MTTIQFQVSDDIIKMLGVEAIQAQFQKYLEWKQLSILAKEIHNSMKDAGVDHDELWETARTKAWTKFKENKLKGVLQ